MDDENTEVMPKVEKKQRLIKQAITHKQFDTEAQRESMSVAEMAKLLELKKTESYYLVHKKHFETRIIGGHMRVMKKSFEKWYRSQFHYKKITGEKPGGKYGETMSVSEAAKVMNVPIRDIYCYIKKSVVPPFEVNIINGVMRVDEKSFMEWLSMRAKAKEEKNV